MTQLLVPMTYAEKLEQELIQVKNERNEYAVMLKNLVHIGNKSINNFREEWMRHHWAVASNRVAGIALEE